jgi:hypothetical protein
MEIWFVIGIVAIIVWLFRGKSSPSVSPTSEIPRIAGDGRFAVEVVGESNYLHSFETICGPRSKDGVNMQTRALLILEHNNKHDSNAVRVSVQGHTVGYLPRSLAANFRHVIRAAGHSRHSVFDCAAVIRGGWDNGRGKQGHYGVWLDIPKDD